MSPYLLAALAGINLLTFVSFWRDKRQAARGRRRTPEARLLLLVALGGAPCGWLALRLLRHKSRKRSFQLKMLLASMVCAALLVLAWRASTEGGVP